MAGILTFRSAKFPSVGTEEEGVNVEAGIFGKRLADYLALHLPSKGFPVRCATAEDWGWMVEIEHDEPFALAVCCGHVSDGASDAFHCFLHPDKPKVRRWLKSYDTTAKTAALAQALEDILRADADIRELTWA